MGSIDSKLLSRTGIVKPPIGSYNSSREGINQPYRLLGHLLLQLYSRSGKVRYQEARKMIQMEVHAFEDTLITLSHRPNFADHNVLIQQKIMKRKHVIYSSYLGALSTLPVLGGLKSRSVISKAIFAKMSMAVGTKSLDNLNDDWQTKDEACASVERLADALIWGEVNINQQKTNPSWLAPVENSCIEITSWVGRTLSSIRDDAPFCFSLYQADVKRWIKGQQDSFLEKERGKNREEITKISQYLARMAEKSTGSLWVDPDVCFFESHVGGLDDRLKKMAISLRASGDLLTKACLLYDDAVDLLIDVKNSSVNAALVYAEEMNILERSDAIKMNEQELVQLMYSSGVIKDVLSIGDFLLAKAMQELDRANDNSSVEAPIEVDRLKLQCKILRLFNMRKLMLRDKSLASLRLGLSMKDADEIMSTLPEKILALDRFVYVPQ